MKGLASSQPNLVVKHYELGDDLLSELAAEVIQRFNVELPNLSRLNIFLSEPRAASQCRRQLLAKASEAGYNAILGADITTLPIWTQAYAHNDRTTVDIRSRELLLVEALLDHPQLYGKASPWALAASLLEFFDQLSARAVVLPENQEQFAEQLNTAYGANQQHIPYLDNEANLVFQLWQAMRQQLEANHFIDETEVYNERLEMAIKEVGTEDVFYFVGLHAFSPNESQFIQSLSTTHSVTLLNYNTTNKLFYVDNEPVENSQSAEYSFLDYIYQHNIATLSDRKSLCCKKYEKSPLTGKVKIYSATHSEQEAFAIDMQIRQWLHTGKNNIAFITNNRKLARRVRALLERSGIILHDEAGWNLSTTSVASTLEHWLRCIDSDFHYLPFLDLLKSPFIFADHDHKELLNTVYRFQRIIVSRENIASGLERYIKHAQYVINRTEDLSKNYYDHIIPLLEDIKQAAQPLLPLLSGRHPPSHYLSALRSCMDALMMVKSFEQDDAGKQILDEIGRLQLAASRVNIQIEWMEFRLWLGHSLETQQFQPPIGSKSVQIMSLSQSDLQQFDGIIIGGAEKEYLPGIQNNSPFFNDNVRHLLGLETTTEKQNQHFCYFRRLLENNLNLNFNNDSALLITLRTMNNNQEVIASPWLECLQSIHHFFYDDDLAAKDIESWLATSLITPCTNDNKAMVDETPIPQQQDNISIATVHKTLIPKKFSATSYQQLVNCPYQFFALRCLKLSIPDQIREYLAKSDYGERVHRCLQAFHGNITGLPGPFSQQVTKNNQEQACQLLCEISNQVFSEDIETNFAHRALLGQWLNIVPNYIDWLIKHQQQWHIDQVETKIEDLPLNDFIHIDARLDRVDRDNKNLFIIDYKTGIINSKDAIEQGEAVQLPFYAIANNLRKQQMNSEDNTKEVGYLTLNSSNVRLQHVINDQALSELVEKTTVRLKDIVEQLHQGKGLPAWGDDQVCQYCEVEGLCRKQYSGGKES